MVVFKSFISKTATEQVNTENKVMKYIDPIEQLAK